MPAGKISLQLITQKHPKIKVHRDKNSDADKLDCGIDLAELASVRHSLLEWLCSEGWEPFAATTDEVYLKRQI
jgi:hypothetical protein